MKLSECGDAAMVVLDHLGEKKSKSTQVDLQRKIENEMAIKMTLRCGLLIYYF